MAKWLIIIGLALLAVGVLYHYAPWLLNWFGRLPGDIHIDTGRTRIWIPITSMILVIVVLSLILNLFRH